MKERQFSVFVRVRPSFQKNAKSVVSHSDNKIRIIDEKRSRRSVEFQNEYKVDGVIPQTEDNYSLYSGLIEERVGLLFKEKSSTVMAYGATGTGKTYTMFGSENTPGLVDLAVQAIFEAKASFPKIKAISVSYLEIYNEKVNDLLNTDNKNLDVFTFDGGKVRNLTEVPARSADDVEAILAFGNKHRITGRNSETLISQKQLLFQISRHIRPFLMEYHQNGECSHFR